MPTTAKLRIEIDRDRGEAKLSLAAGEKVSLEELRKALAAQGVVASRMLDSLQDPIESASTTVVASAMAPVPGSDGRLELCLATEMAPGRERPDGGIDFRDRGYFHQVRAGDRLARYTPPSAGKPGIGLDGQVVPARQGEHTRPQLGPGVAETAGGVIVARRDGVVVWVQGRVLDVTDVVEHKGDVDFVHGNLDVRGTLLIHGDVRPDFTARATGDVVVKGHVDQGTVESSGNVKILGSIIGGTDDDGGVRAGGNILCHHAIDARLVAGGTIEIQDSLFRCDVLASHLECERGHGRIVGGAVRSLTIRVKVAGSEAGIQTLLSVAELESERRDLRDAKRDRDNTARKASLGRPKGGKIGRNAATSERTVLAATLALRRRQREELADAQIVVTERLFAGTTLRFGGRSLAIENDRGPTRATFDFVDEAIHLEDVKR